MNLFRFVGIPNATVMHHLDMCLEEYIEYLMADDVLAQTFTGAPSDA